MGKYFPHGCSQHSVILEWLGIHLWNTLYIANKILFLNICKKIVKSSHVKPDKSVASSPFKVTDSDVLNMDALDVYMSYVGLHMHFKPFMRDYWQLTLNFEDALLLKISVICTQI